MKKAFILALITSIFLSSCSSGSIFSKATETPTITPTIAPSSTSTPIPTQTPTPTPTPIGSGLGKLVYVKDVKSDSADAYVSNIFIYDFAIKEEVRITNNEKDTTSFIFHDVNWSPDGKSLVYSASTLSDLGYGNYWWNSIIYTMNADGTGVRMVTSAPQFVGNYEGKDVVTESRPSFIDNESILFLSNRKYLQNFRYEILQPYIVNTKTLEVTSPFNTYKNIEYISMSPDKTKIAFMADNDSEIYIANLMQNTKITQITNNTFADRFPVFSPNGDWVVFHSDRDGNTELYIMKPDGSDVKRITSNPATDATASWSPDGNWLSFYSDQTGVNEAYIQNIYTNERIQITNGGDAVSFVRWSP